MSLVVITKPLYVYSVDLYLFAFSTSLNMHRVLAFCQVLFDNLSFPKTNFIHDFRHGKQNKSMTKDAAHVSALDNERRPL